MKWRRGLAVLCGMGAVLSACGTAAGGPQATGEQAQAVVGVYPDPDYTPDVADLQAVPYGYAGQGAFFSVQCRVRALTEEEQAFQVQQKQADLAQFEQLQQEYPARGYQAMIEKTADEIHVLREAETVYVTEVTGAFIGDGQPESDTVQYEIANGDETYIAAAAALDAPVWVSLLNTADGACSQGVLLPCKDGYEVTVRCGERQDHFALEKE